MADIKDKLKELLATKGLMAGSDLQAKIETLRQQRLAGAFDIEKVVPGAILGEPDRGFFLVASEYPLDHLHGHIRLGAVLEAVPDHIALCACDDELKDFVPRTAAFVDIETAGLAGGTGTVAFLIGVGFFISGAFRLEQCFMRDYDDEEPLLEYLGPLLGRFESVVTYNGKSFDLPLLRSRFISNRVPFRLDGVLHFDLLHASRRFWKTRLKDCSLGNVERAIIGLKRHGDVPSWQVPQLWFDYLRSRDARPVAGVFNHHRDDILSLVSLTAWLSQCLQVPDGGGFEHVEDRLSLLRLHHRRKCYAEVIAHGKGILEIETEEFVRRECLQLVADAYKRLDDWEQMEALLQLLLREFPKDLHARLELAKYHEHRTRNLEEAQRICRETLHLLELRETLGRELGFSDIGAADFQYRLERIERKLARLKKT